MKRRVIFFVFLPLVFIFLFTTITSLFANDRNEGKEKENKLFVSKVKSSNKMVWTGGNEESPLMHPGGNCIECHSKGEGPVFTIAGTVYSDLHAKVDYFGVSGVKIVITDAKNRVVELFTNKAGNFFTGKSIIMPFKAKVLYNGKVREMLSPRSTGNCAMCHTEKGDNGAPGRIIIQE